MALTIHAEARTDLMREIMELWQKFYTVHEIAKLLNITPEEVQATKNEARRIAAATHSGNSDNPFHM